MHSDCCLCVCSVPAVADMGRLAQEALGCQAEVLCGGLGGPNRDHVLQHIVAGHPLLIPYPRVREGAGLGWGGGGGRVCVSRGRPTALALTAVQLRRGLQPRAMSEEGPQGPLGCERRWVPPPLPWTLTVGLPDPQSPLLTCSPSCQPLHTIQGRSQGWTIFVPTG